MTIPDQTPDPYAEAKQAYAIGELQVLEFDGHWWDWAKSTPVGYGTPPHFDAPPSHYRRRPKGTPVLSPTIDPYAEAKQAWKDGELEFRLNNGGHWQAWDATEEPSWQMAPDRYRRRAPAPSPAPIDPLTTVPPAIAEIKKLADYPDLGQAGWAGVDETAGISTPGGPVTDGLKKLMARKELEKDQIEARARTGRGFVLAELGRLEDTLAAIAVADPQGEVDTGPNPLYHLTVPGYESLASVLRAAYAQAADGKGKDRHAGTGVPFEDQPMQTINREQGSIDGFLYQARKKALEAKRLPPDRDIAELLGAINYLAGAVVYLRRERGEL